MGTLRPKYLLYGYMEPLGGWLSKVVPRFGSQSIRLSCSRATLLKQDPKNKTDVF